MTPNPEQSERLLALAERVEAAEGPDHGLDAEIELVIGNWCEHHYEEWSRFQECGEAVNPPMAQPCDPRCLTSSLDAAMSLVPKSGNTMDVFSVECWTSNGIYDPHVRASAWVPGAKRTYAANPALALTAASLRARARAGDGA